MSRDTQRIQHLNDRFRQDILARRFEAGDVHLTSTVATLSPSFIEAILDAVGSFTTFTKDTDPWGEHDFGSFSHGDKDLFWKIDYFDLTMQYGAENPACASQTKRVLTIMLADEY